MAEQEIVGLRLIAEEMNISVPGLYSLIERDGFLVYRKRLARVRPGARRWAWATTPSLIHAWRTAKAITDRREFLAAHLPAGKAPRER
jgi:hypothetical protein